MKVVSFLVIKVYRFTSNGRNITVIYCFGPSLVSSTPLSSTAISVSGGEEISRSVTSVCYQFLIRTLVLHEERRDTASQILKSLLTLAKRLRSNLTRTYKSS
jgi:hypothetical protein